MIWQRIVIHHTVTRDREALLDLEEIRRYHTAPKPRGRGWSDIGYHWVVEQVGRSVYAAAMARPMYRIGSHVGGHNTGSIGVALVGDWSRREPPVACYNATAELCAALCRSMGIRSNQIFPHRHFRSTLCPGRVDVERIRSMVALLRTGRFRRASDLPKET